jgi:hypothetical protein
MSLITIPDLRLLLRLNGISTDTYTDTEMESLLEYYTSMLNSLLCFEYETCEHTEYQDLTGDKFTLLDYYPIQYVTSVSVDDKEYSGLVKRLDKHNGVIYFTGTVTGELTVTYATGWTENKIKQYIRPLLVDLMITGLKYGNEGRISSLHEGDVSVTYDMSSLLDVNNRITDLNKRFSVRARLL